MSEKKKSVKKEVKKEVKVSGYKITKPNGNVIKRDSLEDVEIKLYESKGCKVEGV
jgi:autonomous glycyl radical cofactor GrcA